MWYSKFDDRGAIIWSLVLISGNLRPWPWQPRKIPRSVHFQRLEFKSLCTFASHSMSTFLPIPISYPFTFHNNDKRSRMCSTHCAPLNEFTSTLLLLYFFVVWMVKYDHHRNQNVNNRDYLDVYLSTNSVTPSMLNSASSSSSFGRLLLWRFVSYFPHLVFNPNPCPDIFDPNRSSLPCLALAPKCWKVRLSNKKIIGCDSVIVTPRTRFKLVWSKSTSFPSSELKRGNRIDKYWEVFDTKFKLGVKFKHAWGKLLR